MTENEKEIPKYLDNPCGKLYNILVDLDQFYRSNEEAYINYINTLVDMSSSDLTPEIMFEVQNLLLSKYLNKTLSFFKKNKIIGAEKQINLLEQVRRKILSLPKRKYIGREYLIDLNILNSLEQCSILYSNFLVYSNLSSQKIFSDEEKKQLISNIKELYCNIQDFPFDDIYKKKLLKIVSALGKSIQEYENYIDSSEIEIYLDKLLGSIILNTNAENVFNEENKNKLIKIISKVKEVANSVTIVLSPILLVDKIINLIK